MPIKMPEQETNLHVHKWYEYITQTCPEKKQLGNYPVRNTENPKGNLPKPTRS